ncbi:serine hydrolase domain-containing protein [Pseudarthrobacter sulfonivorans]|uniref:serine hydrolase domain-containing protein n=1 Tax=Pseudarthrobacter sulfonivorans TaxID=121292 RepID=UPI0028547639|nr:serine hydrolase domain-containing protein [Pseudarthrobacter sulfonivorans]MDR6417120.1 CubicO group peptidase (beta-lactamase class C family) [Pseudarthrobacter sulfonivorans]
MKDPDSARLPREQISTGTPPPGLTTALRSMMLKASVPGVSVAVVDRDRVVFAGGYGLADLAARSPATASTTYLWFSMTKMVTATAALRLADDGRLDLATPVGEYVDYLRGPGKVQPSVGQLLTHTSGLGNPLPIRWAHAAEAAPPDPEALLRKLMARRRAYRYPVGQMARYSNVGYLAAGQIISAAAGMPYEDYARKSVLQPLGMHNTGFRQPTGAATAKGYLKAPRIADPLLRRLLPPGIAGDRYRAYLSLNPFHVDGPAYGGLAGDVLDAAKFLRMHLRNGDLDGKRVLTPESARRMRVIEHAGEPFAHGIGWFRRSPDSTTPWVEHFGTGVGFWNVMRLYPDHGMGVVIMSNSTAAYDFEPLMELLVGASWQKP